MDPSGLLVGRHRRQRTSALIDASVTDDLLTIIVRRVNRFGVRIPRRWAGVAPIPLTDLPKQLSVRGAHREGDRVRFRLEIPELTGSFDLAQIRTAIVAGTTLIIF